MNDEKEIDNMVYHGTETSELIAFVNEGNMEEAHYIELTKVIDKPTFLVTSCCDPDWGYEFMIDNNSDYDRVKFCIIEAIYECETMEELLKSLSEIFEEGFGCILVGNEYECDCENGCNNCNCLN